MHDRTLLGPADLEDGVLARMLVAQMGTPATDVTLLESHAEEYPYDLPSITTGGRYVVRGTVAVDGRPTSFEVFVKVVQSFSRSPFFQLVPEEMRDFAEASVPWRTEALAYRSDLGDRLPPGLRMPRALGVFDLDDRSAAIWLEKVCVVDRPWDTVRYARAAHLLGRLSGSPRVAGLGRVGEHPFTMRDYGAGRLAHQVLPQLLDDDFWAHPQVAAAAGDDLRDRLRATAGRAPALVEELMSLPHLPAHGDACPNNLLATADSEDFTLIDYGFWMPMPAGADLGQLLLGEVQLGRRPAGDLAARDDAHLAAYVEGLRAEGCEVAETDVRRGHAVHMLLMSGLSAVLYEGLQGPPAPDLAARMADRAAIARFCLDRVEETQHLGG